MSDAHDSDMDVATDEPIVTTKTAPKNKTTQETRTKKLPPFNVVILNDEEHTFDYVIELLTKLFAHTLKAAIELTWRIHLSGRAVVYTTHKEKSRAEARPGALLRARTRGCGHLQGAARPVTSSRRPRRLRSRLAPGKRRADIPSEVERRSREVVHALPLAACETSFIGEPTASVPFPRRTAR